MNLAIIVLPTGIALLCCELNKNPLLRSKKLMISSIVLIFIGVVLAFA